MRCSNCGEENVEGAKFCKSCGEEPVPPQPVCPNCGTEVSPEARFCGSCGQNLGKPAAEDVPEPPAQKAQVTPRTKKTRVKKSTGTRKKWECANCGETTYSISETLKCSKCGADYIYIPRLKGYFLKEVQRCQRCGQISKTILEEEVCDICGMEYVYDNVGGSIDLYPVNSKRYWLNKLYNSPGAALRLLFTVLFILFGAISVGDNSAIGITLLVIGALFVYSLYRSIRNHGIKGVFGVRGPKLSREGKRLKKEAEASYIKYVPPAGTEPVPEIRTAGATKRGKERVRKTSGYPVSVDAPYPNKLSRGLLLAKVFLGFFYVIIPHGIALLFYSIGVGVVTFLGFWAILFTGKFPPGMHEFVANYVRWDTRVMFYWTLLCDKYPPFTGKVEERYPVTINIVYPERLSRGILLLKVIFGFFYVIIPHGIVLIFYSIGSVVVTFIAFWAILFTAKYPKGMYEFSVGYYRYLVRVIIYLSLLHDSYPPFSGRA